MAKTMNINVNSGVLKFNLRDSDGDIFARFHVNPADARIASRCEEVSNFFSEKKNSFPEHATAADVAAYDAMITEKICYVLGYDARADLFGVVSATTVLPDGDIFAVKVMGYIADAVLPELQKRKKAMQAAAKKYTDKYTK